MEGDGEGSGGGQALQQECACQAVELATLFLRAGDQRVKWVTNSALSLVTWFEGIRSKLISAIGALSVAYGKKNQQNPII